MKSKDIFGLLVRFFGLIFFYQALGTLQLVLTNLFFGTGHFWRNLLNLVPSLLNVVLLVVISWWMVRGAPWLIRLAYREEGQRDQQPNNPTTRCD